MKYTMGMVGRVKARTTGALLARYLRSCGADGASSAR